MFLKSTYTPSAVIHEHFPQNLYLHISKKSYNFATISDLNRADEQFILIISHTPMCEVN